MSKMGCYLSHKMKTDLELRLELRQELRQELKLKLKKLLELKKISMEEFSTKYLNRGPGFLKAVLNGKYAVDREIVRVMEDRFNLKRDELVDDFVEAELDVRTTKDPIRLELTTYTLQDNMLKDIDEMEKLFHGYRVGDIVMLKGMEGEYRIIEIQLRASDDWEGSLRAVKVKIPKFERPIDIKFSDIEMHSWIQFNDHCRWVK